MITITASGLLVAQQFTAREGQYKSCIFLHASMERIIKGEVLDFKINSSLSPGMRADCFLHAGSTFQLQLVFIYRPFITVYLKAMTLNYMAFI